MTDSTRLTQLADRIELEDLLTAYVRACDDKDWHRLRDVFVHGAHIDYTGAYGEILAGDYHRRGEPRSVRGDLATAGQNFSDRAGKVFEDTDRYVNDALTGFMESAKRLFDDSI